MSETINFELVSPERRLVSEPVKMAVIPGTEGQFGVLAGHSSLVATLKAGVVELQFEGQESRRIFIAGGFADVTPAGLTVLAEIATPLADVDRAELSARIDKARADLETLSDEKAMAHRLHIDGLEAIFNMV